ncbi:hypothetical protein LUZ60_009955 [Juncus effusus]|nr:hypothetical protein LUZ60_009955 [Juncus effusus]
MDQPNYHSLLPLSSKSPPFTNPNHSSSSPSTLLRLATILTLIGLSLWANYEATKGFDLTILNASTQTLAGHRFNLLFVSNGRASKLALKSSSVIERVLYPQEKFVKKPVHHVTIRLADKNLTRRVVVRQCDSYLQKGEYLIELSPSLMVEKDVIMGVKSALNRAMAYVWLTENAPQHIVEAMVDYLMTQSGFSLKNYERDTSAFSLVSFMEFCEEKSHGFFARLNNAMQEKSTESLVNNALFSSSSEMMCLNRIISMSEKGLGANGGLDLELNQSI